MALKTIIEEYTRAEQALKNTRNELGNLAPGQIAAEIAAVLPEGTQLEWMQYTPYFNDGSPCNFGVREPYIHAEGHVGVVWTDYLTEDPDAYQAAYDVHSSVPETLMKDSFGDHVKVVIRKDGTYETINCSHD